jgi:hypothetical protein
MLPQLYARGSIENSDKFAIRLVTNLFVDTLSFPSIKKDGRTLNIYKWQNDIYCKKNDQMYSGWVPWLHYSRRKWSRYNRELMPSILEGPPLMPSHKTFSSFEALKEWIGSEEFQNILIDII